MYFMANLFYKKVPAEPKDGESKFSIKKVLSIFIISALIFFTLGIIVFQTRSFSNKLLASWDEIKFAYNKPALVKTVRQDYEEKQNKLDQSFLNPKSTEDKIVDEVVKRLETTGNLK